MEINNIMDDTEIRLKGINALYKSLGSAAAMRFLTLLHKTPTDYVEISKTIYQDQTIDEIFTRGKQNLQD
ncbi:hypothetical protein PQG02_11540 [Nostoc sp. UHCC 0926]|nr:hypothetical protein [Nostoc sp. UHCC 0926]WDD34901.1 hypothetical protein PQG02_11540 [Nostoc sp. UHCC 0926]